MAVFINKKTNEAVSHEVYDVARLLASRLGGEWEAHVELAKEVVQTLQRRQRTPTG